MFVCEFSVNFLRQIFRRLRYLCNIIPKMVWSLYLARDGITWAIWNAYLSVCRVRWMGFLHIQWFLIRSVWFEHQPNNLKAWNWRSDCKRNYPVESRYRISRVNEDAKLKVKPHQWHISLRYIHISNLG